MKVNSQSLLGCSHQDAVNVLHSVRSDLAISVCNGFDASVSSSCDDACKCIVCQVNGQSLLGCSHQDAVNVLRSVGSDLAISVCDGFDASVLSSLEAGSPSANRNSVIRFNSQSSIDRDSSEVYQKLSLAYQIRCIALF